MRFEIQLLPSGFGWMDGNLTWAHPGAARNSVEVELAQRLAFRGVFGLAQSFSKLLFKQVFLVLLRLHALTEDGLLALILVAHGFGGGLQVFKHALAGRRGMADQSADRKSTRLNS